MLDRRRVEIGADLHEETFAFVAIIAEHADLDELVREEIDVDFVEHGGREPVRADADYRPQRVRLGAERASRRGC